MTFAAMFDIQLLPSGVAGGLVILPGGQSRPGEQWTGGLTGDATTTRKGVSSTSRGKKSLLLQS